MVPFEEIPKKIEDFLWKLFRNWDSWYDFEGMLGKFWKYFEDLGGGDILPTNDKFPSRKVHQNLLKRVQILNNVLLRKSRLKFLEDINMKKIHIAALPTPIG